MPDVDVIVIELSSPILVGVYQDGELIQSLSSQELSSEALPTLFKSILKNYTIKNIVYTRGPGSFMAIKIAYIFLRTLCIVNNIKLLGTNAFTFNENQPIKALVNFILCKAMVQSRLKSLMSHQWLILNYPKKLN